METIVPTEQRPQDILGDIDPDSSFFNHIKTIFICYQDKQLNEITNTDQMLLISHTNSRSLYAILKHNAQFNLVSINHKTHKNNFLLCNILFYFT